MSQPPHDEFLELCALSTSGELTGEEQERLQEHLAVCPACREAMKQYGAVIAKTIPALAPDPESSESDPTWSQEKAEALFFQRLKLEEESGTDRGGVERNTSWTDPGGVPFSASQATWRDLGRSTLPAFCFSSLWAFPPITSASTQAQKLLRLRPSRAQIMLPCNSRLAMLGMSAKSYAHK